MTVYEFFHRCSFEYMKEMAYKSVYKLNILDINNK